MDIGLVARYFTVDDYANANLALEYLNRGFDPKLCRDAWAVRVICSLWPKSEEKKDAKKLLDEWSFDTDNCTVKKSDVMIDCELCGHPETKYRFTIKNSHNGKSHECGSVCICYFLESCNSVTNTSHDVMGAFKKMNASIRDLKESERIQSILDQVEKSTLSPGFKDSIVKLHLTKNPKVTPKQANVLITNSISAELLKIKLSKRNLKDAADLYEVIKDALSNEQQNRMKKVVSEIRI